MSGQMLRLQPNGTVSCENLPVVVDLPTAETNDHSLASLGDVRNELSASTTDIRVLQQIAVSMEALGDTIYATIDSSPLTAAQAAAYDRVLLSIAEPLGLGVEQLTLTRGDQYSVEGLVETLHSIWTAIINGIKRLIAEGGKFITRTFGLTANLRRQLKNALADLKPNRNKTVVGVEAVAPTTMAVLSDEAGEFDPATLVALMTQYRDQVKWGLTKLAPDTVNFVEGMGNWVAQLPTDSDANLVAGFEKVRELTPPTGMDNWATLKSNVGLGMIEKVSPLGFGNHQFSEILPKSTPVDAVDFLDRAVQRSSITYGYAEDRTVQLSREIVVLPSPIDLDKTLQLAIEICDYIDVYRSHSERLTKAMNGLMSAGDMVIQGGGPAKALDNASVAKLTLAVQSTQAVSLKATQPFRDLLYDALRVLSAITALAQLTKEPYAAAQ